MDFATTSSQQRDDFVGRSPVRLQRNVVFAPLRHGDVEAVAGLRAKLLDALHCLVDAPGLVFELQKRQGLVKAAQHLDLVAFDVDLAEVGKAVQSDEVVEGVDSNGDALIPSRHREPGQSFGVAPVVFRERRHIVHAVLAEIEAGLARRRAESTVDQVELPVVTIQGLQLLRACRMRLDRIDRRPESQERVREFAPVRANVEDDSASG